MDDIYFRGFHREWAAVSGKGWRNSKRMAIAMGATSVITAILGWFGELPTLRAIAASFAEEMPG